MQIINERVATVLARELTPTIERWMKRVDQIPELTNIALSYDERTGHLPQLLEELISRLRLTNGVAFPPRKPHQPTNTAGSGSSSATQFQCWWKNPGFYKSASLTRSV